MNKKIKIYKSGIHFGEEKIVYGNEKSGMIYFSGCHLKCNFCYTKEISSFKYGQYYSEEEFYQLLLDLINKGCLNINLITPSHVWKNIKSSILKIKDLYPEIPIILKISGYQGDKMIREMSQVADIIIPDFKVFTSQQASLLNLPKNYGENFLNVLNVLKESYSENHFLDNRIKQGVLIRHLIIPSMLEESKKVVSILKKYKFKGILNIMGHFIDVETKRIKSTSFSDLKDLPGEINNQGMIVLFNGKKLNEEEFYV